MLAGPALLAAIWLSGRQEDRASAVAIGTGAALALAAAAVLSWAIDSPRPFMDGVGTNYLGHVHDGSLPSDHATLAFALAFGFWLRPPSGMPRLYAPLLAVAVAVGWARVFLGAHYPSDIAGGALVAAVAVASTATPPVRAALRALHTLGEAVRARGIAASKRRLPGRGPSGGSDA